MFVYKQVLGGWFNFGGIQFLYKIGKTQILIFSALFLPRFTIIEVRLHFLIKLTLYRTVINVMAYLESKNTKSEPS